MTEFFKNIKDPSIPIWAVPIENYNYIGVGWNSAPEFVDIDNDGDMDMFIGERDGGINFYRNDTPHLEIEPDAITVIRGAAVRFKVKKD